MRCEIINKLINKRFGRLVVIGTSEPYVRKDGRSETVSIVRCDCGTIKNVRNCSLISGATTSCGCVKREMTIAANKKRSITGMTHSRIYNIFRSMHSRCENKRHVGYKNYGGKGIFVCEEWSDFQAFYEWAVNHGYSDGLSIDRIDSTLGYCPGNCRFITMAEQERNKSTVKKFMFHGHLLTIPQIAERIGINKSCLRRRIDSGIPMEIAVMVKSNKGNNFAKGKVCFK